MSIQGPLEGAFSLAFIKALRKLESCLTFCVQDEAKEGLQDLKEILFLFCGVGNDGAGLGTAADSKI